MFEDAEEFDEIIKNSNLESLMPEANLSVLTMKELHEGLSVLGETIMYVSDFIHAYFMAQAEGASVADRPGLDTESVMYIKSTILNAKLFCENIVEDDDDEENEDES